MTAHVISHWAPRRKRGGWRGFALRRLGALSVTLAALAAATWFAPLLFRTSAPTPSATLPAPPVAIEPPPPPNETASDTVLVTPPSIARRSPSSRRGVPLDANAASEAEDFEILSTDELDAISQAGD